MEKDAKRGRVFEAIRWIGARNIWVKTHERPHFDEAVACALAEMYADKDWVSLYCSNGELVLGINGGDFDEHSVNGDLTKDGECCATLMAKALDIYDQPGIKNLIDFVVKVDIHGKSNPNNIDSIAKVINIFYKETVAFLWLLEGIGAKLIQNGEIRKKFSLNAVYNEMKSNDIERAEEWLEIGQSALRKKEEHFLNVCPAVFEKAEIRRIPYDNGRILKMAVIESDDPYVVNYARSEAGGKMDVIVIKRTSGNVQLFTNKFVVKTLDDVARILRYREQECFGNLAVKDWDELALDGKMRQWDRWFYLRNGKMLLNGSLTATEVKPTKIDFNEIVKIVEIGLNNNFYPPQCGEIKCQKCIMYKWGLWRCRNKRYISLKN
jgi:hypothetical protein